MIAKKYLFIGLLAITMNIFSEIPSDVNQEAMDREQLIEKAKQEINQLQHMYETLIQTYEQEELTPYENKLIKALDEYFLNNLQETNKINEDKVKKAATNLLKHLTTLGSLDDAYGASSIIFMLHLTKTITKYIKEINTMEAKDALEESVSNIRNVINEIFVDPMKERIAEIEKATQPVA